MKKKRFLNKVKKIEPVTINGYMSPLEKQRLRELQEKPKGTEPC